MTIGHVYTLRQAAKLTGVSHSTIRRRHADGEFPNAYKNSDGVWMIPLTDLEQAGIRPRSPERAQSSSTVSAPVTLTQPFDPAQTPHSPMSQAHDRANDLANENRQLALDVEKWRQEAEQAKREVSEIRGYLRGVEGTLEESRLHNRELSARNRDLTQALIALEPPAQPEPVIVKMEPAEPTAPTQTTQTTQNEAHWSESPEGGYTVSPVGSQPAPEPAQKRGWKFWK